jgi:hypothetical protein
LPNLIKLAKINVLYSFISVLIKMVRGPQPPKLKGNFNKGDSLSPPLHPCVVLIYVLMHFRSPPKQQRATITATIRCVV